MNRRTFFGALTALAAACGWRKSEAKAQRDAFRREWESLNIGPRDMPEIEYTEGGRPYTIVQDGYFVSGAGTKWVKWKLVYLD